MGGVVNAVDPWKLKQTLVIALDNTTEWKVVDREYKVSKVASAADVLSILHQLTALLIRGSFHMGPEKHELSAVEFRKPAVAIDHGVGFEGDASLVDAEKVAEQ